MAFVGGAGGAGGLAAGRGNRVVVGVVVGMEVVFGAAGFGVVVGVVVGGGLELSISMARACWRSWRSTISRR